ncbi:hypothetical protein BD626DRAFT_504814 [Schizophyllum amplum]|uniref:Uncharacterized protein n=1 Tax=Schizophyllum amplum TaxID=97359 RepID=A0A550C792_9AGAR|nr:hypothetical protein BD626DRAFT_504814 [Auriculariopsis ampla]
MRSDEDIVADHVHAHGKNLALSRVMHPDSAQVGRGDVVNSQMFMVGAHDPIVDQGHL